jgi:O-antigen/teichoic acid export membrane protein
VGGTILSGQIIQFIYGPEYQPSVLPLRLLIWSVFTVYFNCSFAYCLLACDRQKEYLYSVLTGAAINLALNFALIPRYGMLGAVVATLICEFVILGLILLFSARIVKVIPAMDLFKASASSAFMAFALRLTPLELWLKLPAGVIVYFLSMVIMRGVRGEDVQLLKRLLRGVP